MNDQQFSDLTRQAIEEAMSPVQKKLDQALAEIATLKLAAQQYFTVKEAAMFIRKSPKLIRKLIRAGRLPVSDVRMGSTPCYSISRADLEALMQNCRSGGRVPPRAEQEDLVQKYLPKLRKAA